MSRDVESLPATHCGSLNRSAVPRRALLHRVCDRRSARHGDLCDLGSCLPASTCAFTTPQLERRRTATDGELTAERSGKVIADARNRPHLVGNGAVRILMTGAAG